MPPLPADFPKRLHEAAFLVGQEAAWPVGLTIEVVEWFGAHGFAVLGTELWLRDGDSVRLGPRDSRGVERYYGSACADQRRDESWDAFVHRSAQEAVSYVVSTSEELEREFERPYFNVTWQET